MNEPFKVSSATAVVEVAAVSPGNPPTVSVVYQAENSRGVARQFVRQVSVPDGVLFGRLQSSVKEGDQIEATTVNEWYETGAVSYLADFRKAPVMEQKASTQNGAANVVQTEKSKIVIPRVRVAKAKVRH